MAKDANGNDIPEDRPGNSKAPDTAAKPKTTVDDKPFTNFIDKLTGLGQAATNAAAGTKMLGDNAKPAAVALGEFAATTNSITFGLGNTVKDALGVIEDQRVKTNKAGASGLGGGDQTGLVYQMARSRMTTDQYIDMMNKQSVALQGLGKNANESGKTLTQMTAETRDSQLGKQLQAYGITLDSEYMKLQALGSMYTKERLDDTTEGRANRKKLGEANAELAKELQLSANATGRNRGEIEAEIESRLKEGKYSAALQGMNEDQRKNFIRTQAQVSVFGKSAEDLAATIAIGGRKTEEQQNYLMSMGPKASREFERAAQLSASKDAASREVGRAMMNKALADAAVYRQDDPRDRFRRQIALGGPLADTFTKAQDEDRISQRVAQVLRNSNGTLTPQQALDQVRRDARFERSARNPKEAVQIAANENQDRGAKSAEALAKGFDDAFAKGAGTQVAKAIDSYSTAVFGSGQAADKATKYIDGFIRAITGTPTPKTTPPVPTTTTDGKPIPSPNKMPTKEEGEAERKAAQPKITPATPNPSTQMPSGNTVTPAVTAPVVAPNPSTQMPSSTPAAPAVTAPTAPNPSTQTTPQVAKPTVSTPSMSNPSTQMPSSPSWWSTNMPSWLGGSDKPVSRANTSLGSVGSLLEQFSPNGTPALLHNEEGVINRQQLDNLAKGAKNSGVEAGYKEFASMFDGIKTKISSINTPQTTYNPSSMINSSLKLPTEEPKISAPAITNQQSQSSNIITDSTTLKDVNEQLVRLNTGIMQLVANSSKTVDLNAMQIKATKSLSGNKFA